MSMVSGVLLLAVQAQDPPVLTRAAFVRMVLENHPVARQAALRPRMGDAAVRSARGGFDPVAKAAYDEKVFDDKTYYRLFDAGLTVPARADLPPEYGDSETGTADQPAIRLPKPKTIRSKRYPDDLLDKFIAGAKDNPRARYEFHLLKMHDGAKLATHLTLPTTDDGPWTSTCSRSSSARLAWRSAPPDPCRTVITKSGPTNMLISPVSTASSSSTYQSVLRIRNRLSS